MKWLPIAVVFLAGLLILIVVVGYTLPREHVASRSARYARPPDTVFSVLTDFENGPEWRRNLQTVELVSASPSTLFREVGGHGAVLYEVVEMERPTRLVTRIAADDLPYGGSWTYELEPEGEGKGTRLTITERGTVDNPLFRFLSRFVFSHEATIENYLDDLRRKLE